MDEEGWTGENTHKKLPPNYGSSGPTNLTDEEMQDELSLFLKFIPMEFFCTLANQTNLYAASMVHTRGKNLTFSTLTLFRVLLWTQPIK
jgi:hypothetical protein